jgi:electron transfer flavoprotein beta subunit
MNIIACVKQTPDTAAKLQVEGGRVTWGDSPLIVNPWDEFAYEEALRLKEKFGGKVTALSLGPDSAREALRTCLAVGCDEAVLLTDPLFEGSDVGGTAYILAKAIQKVGSVDAVLLGRQAIDGDTGLTPAALAHHLGWTLLTGVIKILDLDPTAGTIKVERLMDEARQVVAARLPAVISVVKGINEPRYASFMGIRKAAKLDIPAWGASSLGVEAGRVGVSGAALAWPKLSTVPVKDVKVELITANTPQEIAGRLVDKILAEKVI